MGVDSLGYLVQMKPGTLTDVNLDLELGVSDLLGMAWMKLASAGGLGCLGHSSGWGRLPCSSSDITQD